MYNRSPEALNVYTIKHISIQISVIKDLKGMICVSYGHDLVKRYYSTHYKYFMPRTEKEWNWVLDRIDLNFGDIFSSLSRESLILDVGCGVGFLEHYLLKKGFTRIDAIDLSEEQIQVAKEKLAEHGFEHTKVNFYVADAFDYLRKSKGYDVIAMIDFLEHFTKDKVISLLELSYRALNDGGLIILRVINADNPMFARFFYRDFTHETAFTPNSIRQCLLSSGFRVIKIDYEKLPSRSGLKSCIHALRLKILSKLFAIPVEAFSEDLIAVGRK